MKIISAPFTRLAPNDIARPYLPVVIINPHTKKEIKILGLIDNGADECALPSFYADILGHKLKDGFIKEIDTGNGITLAYSHTVKIKIQDTGFVIHNTLIDFLPNLRTPLLGVKSFLSNFILTIDYQNKTFFLQK